MSMLPPDFDHSKYRDYSEFTYEKTYMNDGTIQNEVTQYPYDEINADTKTLWEKIFKGSMTTAVDKFEAIRGEVDPNGVGQHDSGAKLDAGKPDCSLLGYFGLALLEVAKVGTIGAKKYTRGGWQDVVDGENRYTAAMLRHYFKENVESHDEDTGMLHAAQVAWNALARLELMLRNK